MSPSSTTLRSLAVLKLFTLKTVLAVFVAISAFTTGATTKLGFSFVPIIDQGSVLILLLFYASVATLLIHSVRYGYVYMQHQNTAFSMLNNGFMRLALGFRSARDYGSFRRRVRRMSRGRSVLTVTYLLAAMGVVGLIVSNLSAIEAILFAPGMKVLVLAVTTAIIVLLFLYLLGLGEFDRSRFGRRWKPAIQGLAFACLPILFLSIAFFGGSTWVGYLQVAGPRVSFCLEGQRDVRSGTIALPAAEGIIVFFVGDRIAHYLPWSRLQRIDASPSPLACP